MSAGAYAGSLTSSSSQRARSWISSDTAASHPPDASTLGAPAVREPAPGENAPGEPDEALTATASQLEDYFAGSLTSFDLPLALVGTEFQRAVWAALLEIPYGATISYGELARRIGLPSASRAVGMANGRNPVSIVVPCHRVVGADGSLTGYGGGVNRKRFLLALEQRVSGQTLA